MRALSPIAFYRRHPEAAFGLAIAVIAVVGFLIRLVELGERPMHADEGWDAIFSWKVLNGVFEGYDPVYHGPLRFYFTAVIYWLFGESNATARLLAVLAGTATIVLPWFLRSQFGRGVTLIACSILAFSPSILYMTRLGREDAPTMFITLAIMVVVIRFMDRPRMLLPLLFAFLFAAGLAVKETLFISVFIFGSFFLALLAEQAVARSAAVPSRSQKRSAKQRSTPKRRHANVLGWRVQVNERGDGLKWGWMLPAGLVPMLVAFIIGTHVSVFIPLGFYGIFLVFAILRYTSIRQVWNLPVMQIVRRIPAWVWALAVVVFLFVLGLCFTVWFNAPGDFFDVFTEGFTHWAGAQGRNRDDQNWHYYLYMIILNEYFVTLLAVIGSIRIFRKPSFAGKFFVWTALATLISYSWADERFPWLMLHPMVPMSILAGFGALSLWDLRRKQYMPLIVLVLAILVSTTLYRSFTMNYVDQRSPLEMVTQLEQTEEYETAVERITKLIDYSVESDESPLYLTIDHFEIQPALWYFRDYISSRYSGFSSEYAGFLEITELVDDQCPCDLIIWVDTDLAVDQDSGEIIERYPSQIIESLFPQHRIERAPYRDLWRPQETSYNTGLVSGWANWLFTRELWDTSRHDVQNFGLAMSPRAVAIEAQMLAAGEL